MMSPTRIDPKDKTLVRFPANTLQPLTGGNDINVLSGQVAQLPTDDLPVPIFQSFEVTYQVVGQTLREISRQQPQPTSNSYCPIAVFWVVIPRNLNRFYQRFQPSCGLKHSGPQSPGQEITADCIGKWDHWI